MQADEGQRAAVRGAAAKGSRRARRIPCGTIFVLVVRRECGCIPRETSCGVSEVGGRKIGGGGEGLTGDDEVVDVVDVPVVSAAGTDGEAVGRGIRKNETDMIVNGIGVGSCECDEGVVVGGVCKIAEVDV